MNIVKTIKEKILSVKTKLSSLLNEVKVLENTVSDLQDYPIVAIEPNPAFEVVEGLTIRDGDSEITCTVEGDLYEFLKNIWDKKMIPVLKVKYGDFDKYTFMYLPCSLQRWNPKWNRDATLEIKEAFVTAGFINTSFHESKIVLDYYRNVYVISGNSYCIETITEDSTSE